MSKVQNRLLAIAPEYASSMTYEPNPRRSDPLYTVDSGVAVIPVDGPIARTIAEEAPCGTSQERIHNAIEAAVMDASVNTISLRINSPGGVAVGMKELSEYVRAASRIKPMEAVVGGICASAAYWLAASTRHVLSPASSFVGSIGVIYVHDSIDGLLEQFGVERTYLTAGDFKAVGAPTKLSARDREVIEGQLAEFYDSFTAFVADSMRIPLDARDEWANGRLFTGDAALDQGLVTAILPAEKPAKRRDLMSDTSAGAPVDVAKIAAEARAEERKSIFKIITALCGDDVCSRLSAVIDTGMSADQIAAAQTHFAKDTDQIDIQAAVDKAVKQALSAALTTQEPAPKGGADKPDEKTALLERIASYGRK